MRKNGVHNGWDVTVYRQGLADGPGTSMYGSWEGRGAFGVEAPLHIKRGSLR
jgi:hypothetical protein